MKAQLAKLSKAPDPDVVNAPKTAGREITAAQNTQTKKMRTSDFDAQIAAAPTPKARMDLQRQLIQGRIELVKG